MDETGGAASRFPSKNFCLTVLKNFVGEPFIISQTFWYRKKLSRKGGRGREYHDFCQKLFVSPAEDFRRGTL